MSNDQAKKLMGERLDTSQRVEQSITRSRDDLALMCSVVGDFGTTLDARFALAGKPGQRVKTILQRLDEVLRETARGLVQNGDDESTKGSWKIVRDLPFPLERGNYSCGRSTLRADGQSNAGVDQLLISLEDCETAGDARLVKVTSSKQSLDVVFYPETIDRLISVDVSLSECRLHATATETNLSCDPIEIADGDFDLRTETLQVNQSKAGATISVKGRISDPRLPRPQSFEFHRVPGDKDLLGSLKVQDA